MIAWIIPTVLTFADHGALVLSMESIPTIDNAPASNYFSYRWLSQSSTANTLKYTWNQGAEWNSCAYINTMLQVSYVLPSQRQSSQSFLIFGHRLTGNVTSSSLSTNGVIVHIDFRGMRQRECVKATELLAADSDYEVFSPADTKNGSCLMGKSTSYIRRRRMSECYGMLIFMHFLTHKYMANTLTNHHFKWIQK